MGTISQSCPFCRTQAVSFMASAEWQTLSGDKRVLLVCGHCKEGIIREYSAPYSAVSTGGDLTRQFWFGQQWPAPQDGTAPNDTPEVVSRFFEQGTSSLEAGNYDASAMVFRKSLEVATKTLDETLSGKKLIQRIDLLKERGAITADLAQWAHEIRLGGNEAAHDDDAFSDKDCEDLKSFIDAFLTYAFTLPAAVRRRRPAQTET